MSRLPDLSGRAPSIATPTTTRGSGYKLWETRRANLFRRNVKMLIEETLPDDEMRFLAEQVGEYIVSRVPVSVDSLPRGYSIGKNSIGETSLCRDGVALNPGWLERPPERGLIERFARDLKTGLLAEIDAFLKTRGS